MDLVHIDPGEFGIETDIVYATERNFTGRPVYSRPACYLHRDAIEALKKAVALAAALGLKFRIFDAFRPTEAQQVLWNHTPDPVFLADPRRGSPHSRGVAVDLTLTGPDGEPLAMGTAFDAFTPLSHHGAVEIPRETQANRHLLLGLMTAAGWDCYRYEWWHYQLFDARRYPLISDSQLDRSMM